MSSFNHCPSSRNVRVIACSFRPIPFHCIFSSIKLLDQYFHVNHSSEVSSKVPPYFFLEHLGTKFYISSLLKFQLKELIRISFSQVYSGISFTLLYLLFFKSSTHSEGYRSSVSRVKPFLQFPDIKQKKKQL